MWVIWMMCRLLEKKSLQPVQSLDTPSHATFLLSLQLSLLQIDTEDIKYISMKNEIKLLRMKVK